MAKKDKNSDELQNNNELEQEQVQASNSQPDEQERTIEQPKPDEQERTIEQPKPDEQAQLLALVQKSDRSDKQYILDRVKAGAKLVKGSTSLVPVLAEERRFVHVICTNGSVPQQASKDQPVTFPKVVWKGEPDDFLKIFGLKLTQNDQFVNVNTAEKVYRIHRNCTQAQFEKANKKRLRQATENLSDREAENYIKRQYKEFQRLEANGESRFWARFEEVLHIPIKSSGNPDGLDPELIDEMPDDVL